MSENRDKPTGLAYLDNVRNLERTREALFEEWLASDVTVDGPDILEALGTALSFFDTLPACQFGCQQSDGAHLEWHLLARVSSSAKAGMRLLLSGYFAEASALVRNLSEIDDLMRLFLLSRESLEKFRNISEGARSERFGPGQVRRKLNALLHESYPIEPAREYYQLLSRSFAHFISTGNYSHNASEVCSDVGAIGSGTVGRPEMVATLMTLNLIANSVATALLFGVPKLDSIERQGDALILGITLYEVAHLHRAEAVGLRGDRQ